MKPSILRIKGINSFQGEQIIEFHRLVEKGLFGIFGPTGSGKSSILDAITLALYGNISRDSKEFINTETDKGEVSFDFQILDGGIRKTYRVERAVKRKKTGGIETSLARIIEMSGEEITVLAEGVTNVNNEVIRVIGLNVDDFTRSVVLPQGKFSEFLKLTGKERRNMLERIFGLEQYGKNIVEKINKERKACDAIRMDLEGQLKVYEGITEDKHRSIKENLESLLAYDEILSEEIKKIELLQEELKVLWSMQEDLKLYESVEKNLEENRHGIESLRESLNRGLKANGLRPYIEDLKKIQLQIAEKKSNLEKINIKLPQAEVLLKSLEEQHILAIALKEEELPITIREMESCRIGQEVQGRIRKLREDLSLVTDLYSKDQKAEEENGQLLNHIEKNIKENMDQIHLLEKELEKIHVEPAYRESVEEAYNLQQNLERMILEKEGLETDLKNIDKVLMENNLKLDQGKKQLTHMETQLEEFLAKMKVLERNPLRENQGLMDLKLELKTKSLEKSLIEEKTEQKIKVLEELKKLENQYESVIEGKNKINKVIELEEKRVGDFKKELRVLEIQEYALKLAEHLHEGEVCPVCGSKEHPEPLSKVPNGSLELLSESLENAESMLRDSKSEALQLEIKEAQLFNEIRINKKELEKIKEELKGMSLESMNELIQGLEKSIDAMDREKGLYEEERISFEKKIHSLRDEISDLSKLIAGLSMAMEKDEETRTLLWKKNQSLYENMKENTKSIDTICKSLQIENIVVTYRDVKIKERQKSQHEKNMKNLREIVDRDKKESAKFEEILKDLTTNIVKNRQLIEVWNEKLVEEVEHLRSLVGEKDPATYGLELEQKKQRIESEEKTLRERAEKGRIYFQKHMEEKIIEENICIQLEKEQGSKSLDLEKLSRDQGFSNKEELEKHLIEASELKNMDVQISDYDSKVKTNRDHMNRLKERIGNRYISETEWIAVQEDVKSKKLLKDEKSKEIGEMKLIEKTMKDQLKAVRVLKTEEKKIVHRLDLLVELSKMLEGNKFVEYVAINQLKYISKEASKSLKNITRGRYALELDSNGNFIMRDDFNGGIRRATSTLSGGETFLTSLALALALSSHIQLKGSAPLEFFFLDEGFGTLDQELLEVVITALEKLHSEKLSVGIISHVEELKTRVPIKLIVSPPEFGGEGTVVKII